MTVKKLKNRLVSGFVASLMLAVQLLAPATVGATPNQNNKIDICHGTASYSNPYTKINVDKSAADGISGNNNGNGDHYAEHQGPIFYPSIPQHTEWGDIIPPIQGVHSGLNWTTEGQAIYNNNCNFPKGEVEVSKKVDSDGNGVYEGGNVTAYNLGFRWALDNETPTRVMGDDTDAFVGTHTVTEKMVNGYVFTGWYYTNDTQYSCSNPRGTTLPVQIDVVKNQTKKVTFCNQAKNGNITIIKDAQPNDGQDFVFSIEKVHSQWADDFILDDDSNNLHSNTKAFNNLLAGTYVVTEHGVSNWSLADITCSQGASVVIDKAHRKAIITLDHNDAVTCTFVNKKHGKIKVYKHTEPAGDQTNFPIEATAVNGTVLSDPTKLIADGEYEEFTVTQGTYNITETLPAGWTQKSSTCNNVVVDANNLTPSCHITNTKQAKLTIRKDARPSHAQDFGFTSVELGNFALDDDADATLSNSKAFTGLSAGQYTVTEDLVDGWKLAYITCEGTQNYGVSMQNRELQVELKAGDNVTCTFGNDKLNSISGYKFEDVNGNSQWDQGEPTLKDWKITLADSQNAVLDTITDQDGFYTFQNLMPGEYKVCETLQAGWKQTYPTTQDGCHDIVLEGPGQDEWADFGNFKLGVVNGSKFNDVNGNGVWDNGEPTLKDWTITLYQAINNQNLLNSLGQPLQTVKTDQNGTYRFENLAPGDYRVCETQQNAWTRTYPAGSDCHEFTIDASGQVITANFGNKPKPQILSATTSTPQVLANTGVSAGKQLAFGLLILGALGAIHFIGARRHKAYAK